MSDWIKKLPSGVLSTVIVSIVFLLSMVLGGFIYLTAIGADTAEFRSFVNTLMNALLFPFVGLNTLASLSAAKSASAVENNQSTFGFCNHLAKDKEVG